MPSSAAAALARDRSRDAIAVTVPSWLRWMAGITCRRPILAVLSTPQRILSMENSLTEEIIHYYKPVGREKVGWVASARPTMTRPRRWILPTRPSLHDARIIFRRMACRPGIALTIQEGRYRGTSPQSQRRPRRRVDRHLSDPAPARLRHRPRVWHPRRLRPLVLHAARREPAADDRLHARGLRRLRGRRLRPRPRHGRAVRDVLRRWFERLQFDRWGVCREVPRGDDYRLAGPARAGPPSAVAPHGPQLADAIRRVRAALLRRNRADRSAHRVQRDRPRAGDLCPLQAAGLPRDSAGHGPRAAGHVAPF